VARAMFDVLNRADDGEGSNILLLTRHETYSEIQSQQHC
jgi:hypothetical protein